MKEKITAGSIILLSKVHEWETSAWKGHPHKGARGDELTVISFSDRSVLLLVVQEAFEADIGAYWLYCIHPALGPITLDSVNRNGYAIRNYNIKLCE